LNDSFFSTNNTKGAIHFSARITRADAFDTLYIGCEKFPQHDFYPINASGVM